MEFRHYLTRLRAWLWVLALAALGAAALGYLLARQLPPSYEARTTLLVNVASVGSAPSSNDINVSQQLVKTYAVMATQPVVLQAAADELGLDISLDQLGRLVVVQPVRDTQLLSIVAVSPRPEEARDIANSVANTFIQQQRERLAPTGLPDVITVIQPALLPTQPTEPRTPLIVALSAFVGVLLTLALLLLKDYLDDRITTAQQLNRAAAVPTLGSVPRLSAAVGVQEPGLLIGTRVGFTPADEAYTLLRTNLDIAFLQHPWRVLLVTSATHGEGKSTTTANLGLSLAQAGRRVVLIDGNLRAPKLDRLFGLDGSRGVADILMLSNIDRSLPSAVDAYLHEGPLANLHVLAAGTEAPRPTDLLQSSAFLCLLQHLLERAELILVDGPPILPGADSLVLAQAADATLIVVDAQQARAATLNEAVGALRHTATHLAGTVLNRAGSQTHISSRLLTRVA